MSFKVSVCARSETHKGRRRGAVRTAETNGIIIAMYAANRGKSDDRFEYNADFTHKTETHQKPTDYLNADALTMRIPGTTTTPEYVFGFYSI